MLLSQSLTAAALFLANVAAAAAAGPDALDQHKDGGHSGPPKHRAIAPKVMIISMFTPEAEVWYNIPEFNLLAHNITLPGLSPLFPDVHCTKAGDVCQVVTGEAEINAAATLSGLVLSPEFDLRKTYFLIGGIAGISPFAGTIADVTFAQFTIQVALQHEIDARERPANFTTGYFPQGGDSPTEYPQNIYGTEVFEFSAALRDRAVSLARRAKLADSKTAEAYRARYVAGSAARRAPSAHACDSATSDVYFTGPLLGEAFANYTRLVSNGTARYCSTAQEDSATAEALLRGARAGRLDFGRIVAMRTASDFDRPYAGESDLQNLVYFDQGAEEAAVQNIYLAGREIIGDVLRRWTAEYARGLPARNYVGDILNSLPGQRFRPTFGLPSEYLSGQGQAREKRSLLRRGRGRRAAQVLPSMRLW